MYHYTIVILWSLFVLCEIAVASPQQSSSHDIEWSTLFASRFARYDWEHIDIATDNQGNVVVLAEVEGEVLQASPGAFQPFYAGGRELVLARFSPQGALLWLTYYGGSDDENLYRPNYGTYCNQINTDREGNIYITGRTISKDFPVSEGEAPKDSTDGRTFIVKFSPSGRRLWSRVYKDPAAWFPASIVVDSQGNPVVIGLYGLPNIILPPVFLMKFDPDGQLLWESYYGEAGRRLFLNDVAIDSNDAVVFTGVTDEDIPMTDGTVQPEIGGGADAVIVKFDANGQFVWGSYYGGELFDCGQAIAIAPDNDIVVGGYTFSLALPGMNDGSFQPTKTTETEEESAFLLRLTPEGRHIWSTYLGGKYTESCTGLAVARSGKIAVSLHSKSPDIPLKDSLPYPWDGGGGNTYIAEFSGDGKKLLWATRFGPAYTMGADIDYSPAGDILLAGWFLVDMVPVTRGAYQETFAGESAFFITKFGCTVDPPVISPLSQTVCHTDSAELSAPAGYASYLWQPGGATSAIIKVASSGSYRVYVTDQTGCSGISEPATVTVLPTPKVHLVVDKSIACAGETIRIEVEKDKTARCLWSTGETTASIVVSSSGTYSVTVWQEQSTALICSIADSISVVIRTASDLLVDPSPVAFISDACQQSVEHDITVENTRQEYVDLVDMRVVGSAEFSVVSPVGAVRLQPGEQGTIRVRYQPTSPSTTGSLVFRSIPCDIAIEVELRGQTSLLAGPGSVSMGRYLVCDLPADTVVYIENRGASVLYLDDVKTDTPFTVTTTSVSIAPGERVALRIGFAASVAGEYRGRCRVSYRNDFCADTLSVDLYGIAEDADVIVPSEADFGRLRCDVAPAVIRLPLTVFGSPDGVLLQRVSIAAPFSTNLAADMALPAGDHEVEVTFTPSAPGVYQTVIELEFSPCGLRRRIEVRAEYDAISYTVTDAVDFGTVRPGVYQERDIIFTNTSDTSLSITSVDCFSSPYVLVLPTSLSLPMEVPSGSSTMLRVRFIPHQEGVYLDSLCIGGQPCAFSVSTLLTGRCLGVQGRSVVRAPVVESAPGERISLPLVLASEEKLALAGAHRFRCRVSMDELLFAPTGVSAGSYTESHQSGRVQMDIECDVATTPAAGDTLVVLQGLVLYGSSRQTSIAVESFEWLDADVEEESINGQLDVLMCFPTSLRSLPVPRMMVRQVEVGGSALEVNIVEISNPGELELWSVSGEKLYSRHIAAPCDLVVDTGLIGSGVYQLVLTGQRVMCRQVVLIIH